jgi:hypothetical protein
MVSRLLLRGLAIRERAHCKLDYSRDLADDNFYLYFEWR